MVTVLWFLSRCPRTAFEAPVTLKVMPSTSAANPLLQVEFRIPFDQIRAEHVQPATTELIRESRARLAALAAPDGPRTFANTLHALDTLTEPLDWAMGVVRHLESVATYPELRAAFNAAQPEVSAFYTGIPLNAGLWSNIKAFANTSEAAQLEGARRRFLHKTVETFRRHGADLPPEGKKRLEEIDVELTQITTKFVFEYRSRDDFTVRYDEREVSLSHLTSVDFFVSYWKVGPVGHTFLSFVFDNAPALCISIETRPEVGEGFSPIASLFKQFELIYIVGDERDIVRVRTNFRDEEVYLYRIRTSSENVRRLFLVYLGRINELADHAEFYHLLSNSCTVNIVRYANAAGRVGQFDIKHLLNGFIDRYLYRAGLVDRTLPFEELRRRSRINDAALAADNTPDFSRRIRESLLTMRP